MSNLTAGRTMKDSPHSGPDDLVAEVAVTDPAGHDGTINGDLSGRAEGSTMDDALVLAGGVGLYQVGLLGLCGVGWSFAAWVVLGPVFIDPMLPLEWGETFSDWSYTCMFAGWMAGASVFGMVSDRLGRVSIAVCTAVASILVIASVSFLPDKGMVLMGRALNGFILSGGFNNACYLHTAEFITARAQPAVGLVLNVCWAASTCVLAGLCYMMRDARWEVINMLLALPGLLYLFFLRWRYRESPKFLFSKRRDQEAVSVLRHVWMVNEEGLRVWNSIFRKQSQEYAMQRRQSIQETTEENLDPFHMFSLAPTEVLTNSGWVSPILKGRMLVLTLAFSFAWFALAMVYYGLSINPKSSSQDSVYWSSFLMALIEIPGYMIGGIMVHYLDRRPAFTLCFLFSGLTLGLVAIPFMSRMSRLLALGGKLGISAAYVSAFTYIPEVYPTALRGTVMGFTSVMSRVGSLVAPILYGVCASSMSGEFGEFLLPRILFGVVSLTAGAISWVFLPNTKGVNFEGQNSL